MLLLKVFRCFNGLVAGTSIKLLWNYLVLLITNLGSIYDLLLLYLHDLVSKTLGFCSVLTLVWQMVHLVYVDLELLLVLTKIDALAWLCISLESFVDHGDVLRDYVLLVVAEVVELVD